MSHDRVKLDLTLHSIEIPKQKSRNSLDTGFKIADDVFLVTPLDTTYFQNWILKFVVLSCKGYIQWYIVNYCLCWFSYSIWVYSDAVADLGLGFTGGMKPPPSTRQEWVRGSFPGICWWNRPWKSHYESSLWRVFYRSFQILHLLNHLNFTTIIFGPLQILYKCFSPPLL